MNDAAPALIAVFCGSRAGRDPIYAREAAALGRGLAAAGIGIVYGGGRAGLMGVLADAALAAGGTVIGVIPGVLRDRELAHPGLTRLEVVASLHARKARIAALARAIVAMPGGLGTLDELFEMLTWRLLELHAKPIYVCDCGGWARGLRAALDAALAEGFCGAEARGVVEVVPDVAQLLAALGAA